jgi:hypothetical protein
MASTASKWHNKEALDTFIYYYTKGKRCMQEDLNLRYKDIISFLKIPFFVVLCLSGTPKPSIKRVIWFYVVVFN